MVCDKKCLCQATQSNADAGKGVANFSRQDMFKESCGIGVQMTDRVFRLQPCHGVLPGLGMLQNLPSAVVAYVLAPTPGSRVLDMCASPGGRFHTLLLSHWCLAMTLYLQRLQASCVCAWVCVCVLVSA